MRDFKPKTDKLEMVLVGLLALTSCCFYIYHIYYGVSMAALRYWGLETSIWLGVLILYMLITSKFKELHDRLSSEELEKSQEDTNNKTL